MSNKKSVNFDIDLSETDQFMCIEIFLSTLSQPTLDLVYDINKKQIMPPTKQFMMEILYNAVINEVVNKALADAVNSTKNENNDHTQPLTAAD